MTNNMFIQTQLGTLKEENSLPRSPIAGGYTHYTTQHVVSANYTVHNVKLCRKFIIRRVRSADASV